eukprot:scaffold11563_cov56-Cylindrotheca_fusiformis.AAC.1
MARCYRISFIISNERYTKCSWVSGWDISNFRGSNGGFGNNHPLRIHETGWLDANEYRSLYLMKGIRSVPGSLVGIFLVSEGRMVGSVTRMARCYRILFIISNERYTKCFWVSGWDISNFRGSNAGFGNK